MARLVPCNATTSIVCAKGKLPLEKCSATTCLQPACNLPRSATTSIVCTKLPLEKFSATICLQPASQPASQCHNLTVRAKGKLLLENCNFTISAGRRYGLVGPNG